MKLTLLERTMMIKVFKEKYLWASKKEKSLLLDQFVETTGFNRSYARTVLRKKPDNVIKLRARKKRISIYDSEVCFFLEKIWEVLDRICGKRLVKAMPDTLAKLEQFKVIKIDKKTKDNLLSISSASVDRLLKSARKKLGRKGTSTTKQPKYLIDRIPSRLLENGKTRYLDLFRSIWSHTMEEMSSVDFIQRFPPLMFARDGLFAFSLKTKPNFRC